MSVSLPFLQALILFVWAALLGIVIGWLLRRFFGLFRQRAVTHDLPRVKSTSKAATVDAPIEAETPVLQQSAMKAGEAEPTVAGKEPAQSMMHQRRSPTEGELAEMARSASALAMVGAGGERNAPRPLAHPDERWSIRIAPPQPSKPIDDWPSRTVTEDTPFSLDWRAGRAAHGDYVPSSDTPSAFRPLDPAIAGAVLGTRVSGETSLQDRGAPSVPTDATGDRSSSNNEADLSAELIPHDGTKRPQTIDLAALKTALWQTRVATQGHEHSLLPPSRTDERMRLEIRPRTVEPDTPRDIYAVERDEEDGSRGADDWLPSRRSEASPELLRPFRPIGDLDALVRTKWGVSPPSLGTLDESVNEKSEDDPILNMDNEIPFGRLWGPAVALPLPSAVAAEALNRKSDTSSLENVLEDFGAAAPHGVEADETAFAIGMDDEARPEHLAASADVLAAQSEPTEQDRAVRPVDESEMRQVTAEDEALPENGLELSRSDTAPSPGPSDDDGADFDGGFEPILREGRDRDAAPVDTVQPMDEPEQPDMAPPVDMIDAPLPADPPAGTEHPHGVDDLSRIKGVGPATEQRLHELGVTSYAQIAAWSADEAAWFGEQLFFPGRVERENWIELARELMADRDGEG